jgi:hypothetical protein
MENRRPNSQRTAEAVWRPPPCPTKFAGQPFGDLGVHVGEWAGGREERPAARLWSPRPPPGQLRLVVDGRVEK